jgi:outer membrane protein
MGRVGGSAEARWCGGAVAGALAMMVMAMVLGVAAVASAQADDVRRLTVDEAVRLALENNLGIRVARIDPLIQDLGVAQASAAWHPTLTSTLLGAGTDSPSNSFLSGADTKTSDNRFNTNLGVQQTLPWGGRYNIGWDASRSTTTNIFSNFSPQVRSSLALTYVQPLLRGLSIDTSRQQLLLSEKDREIADVTLRQAMTMTSRNVRHAYWDLAFAIASLGVQRQSLELARESLRETRARIEIGTTPPIDEVEAESEVALREEAVIQGEGLVGTTEDLLRALIYDPASPDFWTLRIEPAEPPVFTATPIDIEAATRAALARRSDNEQSRKNIEAADINLRFFRDETLPDVTASFDYGLTGLGGTQFLRGPGFPGPIIGQSERGFGSVLGDLFGNNFPSWTASLNVSYPLGQTPQAANVARARLEYTQQQTQLRQAELLVVTQVREAGRQVLTNQRRVQTTTVSRELAERRLEAEERKLAAGTTTTFFVFQAQRDLAEARNNQLRAILDYQRALVDFEAVQEAPLR